MLNVATHKHNKKLFQTVKIIYPGARFNKKKVFTLEGWRRYCYVQQGGIIMR
jgi:hypothetical protein